MVRLDQHFFVDRDAIKRVLKTLKPTGRKVLEIGPGRGVITAELLALKPKTLVAVELDKELCGVLDRKFGKKIGILNKDCLEVDYDAFDLVVGNIPFSLSSPILFKFLESKAKKAVFWFQKEFAEKMVAKSGEENFGRLSVTTQANAKIEILEHVSRFAFVPEPQTDAAIVLVQRKKNYKINADLVNALFQHKRQNVRKALMHSGFALKKTKDELRQLASRLPSDVAEKKVYCLTMEEIQEIGKNGKT